MASTFRFEKRLRDALNSPRLRQALDRAMPSLRQRRATALEGRFEGLRHQATEARERAIEALPTLVEKFREAAAAAGAKVHFAADAAEARRIVGEICQSHGARLVVKSKSMATEEIRLNPYLEAMGMKVVETDLGEWIVQLAGETPSHFLAPAIHKTREEIAELLARETGETVAADDIGSMVQLARKYLRRAFIEADVGISGANMAVAESGTIVVVTNEGNDRLVTTLPPVHIAILGIDKIVDTLEDAVLVLKVLAPSATGQTQTSYVSFITGPSRTADIESTLTVGVHGPSHVHIVLVDNGRSAAWEDPLLREVLRCIRCSACVSVCPPYQVVGGHAFGYIYNGPVGLVLTAVHHGLDNAGGPQSLCAGCNACETVCPVSIPLPDLILEIRRRWIDRKGLPLRKRIPVAVLSSPSRLKFWTNALRRLQRPLIGRSGLIEHIPFMRQLTSNRYLPPLAPVPLSQMPLPDPPPTSPLERTLEGMSVGYFPGCITNYALTSIGSSTIKLLVAMGAVTHTVASDMCCGLPALNAGDFKTARRMATAMLAELGRADDDILVTTSASCYSCITRDYEKLLDETQLKDLAAIRPKFQDITTFLSHSLRLRSDWEAPDFRRPLTYHDSCQSYNVLRLAREPRSILSGILGLPISEMTESSRCCGFGGTFSLEHPQVAGHLLEDKLEAIAQTEAAVVVTDNPGCIAHIRGGMKAKGMNAEIKHLVEVIADILLGDTD